MPPIKNGGGIKKILEKPDRMRALKEPMTATLGQNKALGIVEKMLKQAAEQAIVNKLWQEF